jgi:LPXTG-site transpeptidase (sortase) family protein
MFIKALSLLFLGVGIFVLMQVALPFLEFKSWELFAFEQETELANPLASDGADGLISGVSIQDFESFPAFVANYANPANLPYKEFRVSIPKLKIDNVTTKVWSNDFEETLAQLPGSALPGERGNVFVTGHSSLPYPKNKQAWFMNLPNIKKGDNIYLNAAGQRFEYVVEGLKIVDPKDTSVLNPPDNRGRYLTLMTCVPPGFNTKRLVVLAKLKS